MQLSATIIAINANTDYFYYNVMANSSYINFEYRYELQIKKTIGIKNEMYQQILDKYVSNGRTVGLSIMIKDENGTWLGAAGKADLASDIDMQVGNQFFIASISKVFTSTSIYAYVDDGLISIEDPVNKWIDKPIADKIENANESRIKHLLSHRSGIHDYYSMAFEIDRLNRKNNNWSQEDIV